MMKREYIVTAKTKEDLESLYHDLEHFGKCGCIPEREIECCSRRPTSRNTHYMLTDEEAEKIKNDPRVLEVELTPEERGIIFEPLYTVISEESLSEEEKTPEENPNYITTTSFWSKSTNNSDAHRNWAQYRCVNGATVSNWGSDGSSLSISGTVQITSSGKNVDVVIVDGCFDPAHPEFAVNEAGTGGSRVIQYNWLQHRPEVEGTAAGTYVYTPYTTGSSEQQGDNNHGCHVAGTACGNRRGWARDANIYNINLYSSASTNLGPNLMFDYIRAWHNSKAVNSLTGRKNPTITNNSWGSFFPTIAFSNIEWVEYRGTRINAPNPGGTNNGWTKSTLESYGVLCHPTLAQTNDIPTFSAALQADIDDAIADGIIIIAAAGNDSFKADIPGGVDYNNLIKESGYSAVHYHRGSQPAQLTGVISVGNIDATVTEQKNTSSTTGPRVDIHAPGTNITSSVHSNGGGVTDSRNTSYRIIKQNGTSMASPQVCGVIACLLEQWPRMTQNDVREYLEKYGITTNQIADVGSQTRTWSVTNSGASSYSFSGFSSGSNISITATEGTILTFNINAGGHPFWIKTQQVTGTGSGVTTGTITNNGTQSGTITWNTRGVTPGTYYYICQFHGSMVGTITITNDYVSPNRSLQGSQNRYLYYEQQRKVPNPSGATYIGGATTSQILEPRGIYKQRKIEGQVYPRPHIWHRRLT
jgi:hypothetical protein